MQQMSDCTKSSNAQEKMNPEGKEKNREGATPLEPAPAKGGERSPSETRKLG